MTFYARQVQVKSIEQSLVLYQFLGPIKALDTINMKIHWKVSKKFGCTDKSVYLIKFLHEDMEAKINFNGNMSEPFPLKDGVKQGYILALTLFSLYFKKLS